MSSRAVTTSAVTRASWAADNRVGGCLVADRIHCDAEEREAGRGRRADRRVVLADSAGENDDIQAVHGRGHGCHLTSQPVQVHLDGQRGGLVAGRGSPLDIPDVARRLPG